MFVSRAGPVSCAATLATGPRRSRRVSYPDPGVQRRPAEPPSASSRPGVHSLSRACACSTEMGVARLGQQVDGAALGEVLAQLVEAAGLLQALAQLLRRRALARGGRLQRVEDVAVGGLDALGLDDGRDDRLAAQRALGVGLGLREDAPPRCGRRSAGRPRLRCPGGRASAACAPTARARGPRPAPRGRRPARRAPTASTTASRNSASTRARRPRAGGARCPRAARPACRSRRCRRRSRRRARGGACA